MRATGAAERFGCGEGRMETMRPLRAAPIPIQGRPRTRAGI